MKNLTFNIGHIISKRVNSSIIVDVDRSFAVNQMVEETQNIITDQISTQVGHHIIFNLPLLFNNHEKH